ncbi:hypothetical protein L3X38_018358 [Prunus dulcis]|uniref:Uncharacterized protein n=1 Tax=Prunus dulcis TaxID=3755 RepID=A0AAD4W9K6_PRUDU|nr:hypothetical protein L3X38_018358 [Prunus dulcis]
MVLLPGASPRSAQGLALPCPYSEAQCLLAFSSSPAYAGLIPTNSKPLAHVGLASSILDFVSLRPLSTNLQLNHEAKTIAKNIRLDHLLAAKIQN